MRLKTAGHRSAGISNRSLHSGGRRLSCSALYLRPPVSHSCTDIEREGESKNPAGSLPGRREMSWKVRHPCGTAQLIEIKPTM